MTGFSWGNWGGSKLKIPIHNYYHDICVNNTAVFFLVLGKLSHCTVLELKNVLAFSYVHLEWMLISATWNYEFIG